MIKQPAKVISETNTSYLLESLPKSACPKCDEGKGCGGGLLSKAFSNKTYQLSINKNRILKVSEVVQVGIPSNLLVRASLIVYLLPLLFMVISAVLFGSLTNNQDIYTVTGAIFGFILGILIGKHLSVKLFKAGIASPILIEDDAESCWYNAE